MSKGPVGRGFYINTDRRCAIPTRIVITQRKLPQKQNGRFCGERGGWGRGEDSEWGEGSESQELSLPD